MRFLGRGEPRSYDLECRLAVEPQQVVLGQAEATDRCLCFQATMWPMPVVAMEPIDEFGRPLIRCVVGASISPFAERGLNEALRLAVGSWRVRPGEDLTNAEAFTGRAEEL